MLMMARGGDLGSADDGEMQQRGADDGEMKQRHADDGDVGGPGQS